MKRSDTQEALLHLYLRLNGFFTTGFIVHARDGGRIRTQVDALAVRHPFNSEPERLLEASPFLGLSQPMTDLLICEVKSRGQQLQFNPSLRNDPTVLATVLRWSGLIPEGDLPLAVPKVKLLMRPGCPMNQAERGVQVREGVRVRALLCSPERSGTRSNQPWFLPGSEVFRYLADCLNPASVRATCATRYDFSAWGPWLEPIVRYFKSRPAGDPGTVEELNAAIGTA